MHERGAEGVLSSNGGEDNFLSLALYFGKIPLFGIFIEKIEIKQNWHPARC